MNINTPYTLLTYDILKVLSYQLSVFSNQTIHKTLHTATLDPSVVQKKSGINYFTTNIIQEINMSTNQDTFYHNSHTRGRTFTGFPATATTSREQSSSSSRSDTSRERSSRIPSSETKKARPKSASYVQSLKNKVKRPSMLRSATANELPTQMTTNPAEESRSLNSSIDRTDRKAPVVLLCASAPSEYLFNHCGSEVQVLWVGPKLLSQFSNAQLVESEQARHSSLPQPKKDQAVMDTLRAHDEDRLNCFEKLLASSRKKSSIYDISNASFGPKLTRKDMDKKANSMNVFYKDKGRQASR
jgi:hypothetical protein